jgi:hypothetical protein
LYRCEHLVANHTVIPMRAYEIVSKRSFCRLPKPMGEEGTDLGHAGAPAEKFEQFAKRGKCGYPS